VRWDGRPADRRTALYRLYNSADVLLYVGISESPEARFKEHAGDKLWWHIVARKEITWLDTRTEALDAEAKSVTEEQPLYNGYHQFGKGLPPKAREYDDTAERAKVREGVRLALQRGEYLPGARLQGAPVGRQFGVSPLTANFALLEIAKEGLLLKGDRHFVVPTAA